MDGLFIFDQSMDLIYKKINNEMMKKIEELAVAQNLLSSEVNIVDNNIIIQIFSPLINSQKIMFCQFDNTYYYLQCEENLNFVFSEFLGYIFLKMSTEPINDLKRNIGVCITFAKHICGPNLYELKCREDKSNLYTSIIETWQTLNTTDQCILLEGIDQLIVNIDVKIAIKNTLRSAAEMLQQDSHAQRCHTIIFVALKFAGLFSSRYAQKLSASDILFLCILTETYQSNLRTNAINIQSNLLFFQGKFSSGRAGCIPYIVHTSILEKGVTLTLLIEFDNLNVFSTTFDIFFALQKIRNVQMQGDFENLKCSFYSMESCVKQLAETMKKSKNNMYNIYIHSKKVSARWETLRKKYLEYFKNTERELIVQIESNIPIFSTELKDLFRTSCMECGVIENGFEKISKISILVEENLLEFSEFLIVKAQRNLSIKSYLEEFPGLVHFIYLNRSIGTVTAPDLLIEKYLIPKDKIWRMVELSRSYLQKGYTSIIWKDTAFNYSFFLWFEDQNGIAIKPKQFENVFTGITNVKPEYEPGILSGDFYQRLCELHFPKMSPTKLKCCELYCIHIGLVTVTCALEHSRRLVATIADINGTPPFEIL